MRRLFQTGFVVAALAAALAGCDSEPTTAPVTESAPEQGATSSLEGAFTANSIEEYLDIIAGQLLTPWFQDSWPDVAPPGVTFVPSGQSGAQGCAFDDESLAYCAGDQTVYVGQTALWDLYSQAGDAGPATRLAYEFGRSLTDDTDAAYCLAGTWIRYADDKGWLETDDEQDIEALLHITAATDEQRGSLQTGRDGDVSVCRVALTGRS